MSLLKVLVLIIVLCLCSFLLGLVDLSGFSGEFVGFAFPGLSMEFVFNLDVVTGGCLIMLGVCSFIAFFYCFHYFGGVNRSSISLFPLMVWFVAVMAIMVVSGSLVFTLVMWEYLGFVSFLLILFYSNSCSLRAALVTLFSSRFGDVAMFVLVGGWLSGALPGSCVALSVCVLMVVLTKSASYPFISWLLEAMRAPTPVSSLVHSSTLVAAGVWFVMRYDDLVLSYDVLVILYLCAMISIIITGVCSLYFVDLKKVVALSTCNNVAWCLVFFVWGDVELVLLQLVTHGVSKCFLFMLVGDLMSSSMGSQSSLGVYPSLYGGVFGSLLLSGLVFSLCGLPFLGIFFTKHYFFGVVVGSVYSALVGLILFVGFTLSYAYSFRLMMLLSSVVRGLSSGYVSSFIFVGWGVLLGTVINFLWVGILPETVLLGWWSSVLFILVQLVGGVLGICFYLYLFSWEWWISKLWGCDTLVVWVYSLFGVVSKLSVLGFYRWEIFLLSWFRGLGVCYRGLSIFAIQFLIAGVIMWGVLALLLT